MSTPCPTYRPFWRNVRITLTLLILVLSLASSAQAPQVEARLEKNSIWLGDQIKLSLKATFNPEQNRVQFPSLNDTFNHLEVIGKSKLDTVQQGNTIQLTQQISLTSFDSGRWEIPALNFTIQPLNGDTTYSLSSKILVLNIQTPQVDTSQPFKPIMAIRDAKMPLKEILMYAAIGLLLLTALILLILYLYKRWKKSKKTTTPLPIKPSLSPHEKATKALNELEQKQLWQAGEEKLYYTELSEIVRLYLEEQFKIECFEKTTSEIVYQVKRVRLLNPFRQVIRDTLSLADMVKFAKAKPLADEHIQALNSIQEFVTESNKKVKQNEIKPENSSE